MSWTTGGGTRSVDVSAQRVDGKKEIAMHHSDDSGPTQDRREDLVTAIAIAIFVLSILWVLNKISVG